MDGNAPANQLRLSSSGEDRVKPESNLRAAKPSSRKRVVNLRPLGLSHGTAVCGPACTVVWQGKPVMAYLCRLLPFWGGVLIASSSAVCALKQPF